MSCYRLNCFSLLAVLLATLSHAALAGALQVVAGAGTALSSEVQTPTGRYDFGTRRLSDDAPLTHTFTLRNGGTAAVTVSRLEASCGCTTAVLTGAQALPVTLTAGQSLSVAVAVSPHRLQPGPVDKTVRVYIQEDASQEAALLEIVGVITTDPAPPLPNTRTAVAPSSPVAGQAAPPIAWTDTDGKPFTLTGAQGHSIALFFFCGCPWCADVAKAWGEVQRGSRLPARTQTIVLFAGDKAAASAFASRNGLDRSRTWLLPDPDTKLTEGVYHVADCPRVFALDPAGILRYSNDHPDDLPRKAPAKTIVRHTLAALAP